MSLPVFNLVGSSVSEVKRDVRSLRWFRRAFLEQVTAISQASHIKFDVDTTCLAGAFLDWSRSFEAQKPDKHREKRSFVDFAAGLMLVELLQAAPLKARATRLNRDGSCPATFWPEGYTYVAFCLNIRQAVLKQNFGEVCTPASALDDLEAWTAFQEAVYVDVWQAAPFLDLFSGENPDWFGYDDFRTLMQRRSQPSQTGAIRLVWDDERSVEAEQAPSFPVRQSLDPSITRVLVDLRVMSNQTELYVEELTNQIQAYGVPISHAETAARFADAPINLAITHVAILAGQICPSAFISSFEARLATRYRQDLASRSGLAQVVRELANASVSITVVSQESTEHGRAFLERFMESLPDTKDLTMQIETCDAEHIVTLAKPDPKACMLVSDDKKWIAAAKQRGVKTIGIAAPVGQRRALDQSMPDIVIDGFHHFPKTSV